MEIILAIVVASAVIFFGALISMGNERQRKAIDGLREQVVLWAVQDLKIKREHLAQTVQVPNPIDWLNKTASKVYGYDLKLQVLEIIEEPQALICISGDNNLNIAFSPLSPTDLRQILKGRQNRLSRPIGLNTFFFHHQRAVCHELSVLNSGMLFDLELHLAWKSLTGYEHTQFDSLWMYTI